MKKILFKALITAIISIAVLLGLIYIPYIELWEIDYLAPNRPYIEKLVKVVCFVAFSVFTVCIYKLIGKKIVTYNK